MVQHSDAIIRFLHEYKGKHLTVYKIKLYLNENNIDLLKNLWLEYKENTKDKTKIQIWKNLINLLRKLLLQITEDYSLNML